MTHLAARLLRACARLGLQVREGIVPPKFCGPRGVAGCNPARRTVYFGTRWRTDADRGIDAWPEVYLHEAMHAFLQPPGHSIHNVPEDWLLLQVERAYARMLFGEGPAMRKVLAWQEATSAPIVVGPFYPNELAARRRYGQTDAWRAGYARGKTLGVLDARGRPTFHWPDWTKLTFHPLDDVPVLP